jgi:hypothetical protein
MPPTPSFSLLQPSTDLAERVAQRISRYERRRAASRLGFGVVATLASCAALVPTVGLFWRELSNSAFISYLTLAWTDSGAVFSAWREFSLLLMESLPVLSLALVLASILALIGSLRAGITSARSFAARPTHSHLPS